MVVSGPFVGTEVRDTLPDVVMGYVATVVRTRQLVTSGGQLVTVMVSVVRTTLSEVIVNEVLLLLIGYGTPELTIEVEDPLDAPVGWREKEPEAEVVMEVEEFSTFDELTWPVPVGPPGKVELAGSVG